MRLGFGERDSSFTGFGSDTYGLVFYMLPGFDAFGKLWIISYLYQCGTGTAC